MMISQFENRVLFPSDRYAIAQILKSQTRLPVYSICLFEELLSYLPDAWAVFSCNEQRKVIAELLRNCMSIVMHDERLDVLSVSLRFHESDVIAFSPDMPSVIFPLPAWLFPRALVAVCHSFCKPRYWDWHKSENAIEKISIDDYDAALILCMMSLSTSRKTLCIGPGDVSDEFYSLDTLQPVADVVQYWSSHVLRIQRILCLDKDSVRELASKFLPTIHNVESSR